MKFWARSLIAISLLLVVSVMSILLLNFLGHEPLEKWNDDVVKTNCSVVSHKIDHKLNCKFSCGDPFGIGQDTCIAPDCYNPLILLKHTVGNNTYERWDALAYKLIIFLHEERAISKVEKRYPINNTLTCYYHPDEPEKFRMETNSTGGFSAGMIIFGVIGIIILVVWGVIEFFKNKNKLPCFG